ncbi:uncharacterized protein LOC141829598 [Curcuma longa]|uniref:uncharacterized protein LOC141829598 n=1 Tax=Curcuma longa TaxID=136217 RepID=UPI003D9DE24E
MATTAFLAPSGFSIQGLSANGAARGRKACPIRAQQQQQLKQEREQQSQTLSEGKSPAQQQQNWGGATVQQQPPPPQPMAKSKNMSREYGGQWLSSCTRHVRIYAAYIDPVTHAFDQTQMDKLTLILDPTDEFVWTPDTCQKVYAYFQELVDHYEVRGFVLGMPISVLSNLNLVEQANRRDSGTFSQDLN